MQPSITQAAEVAGSTTATTGSFLDPVINTAQEVWNATIGRVTTHLTPVVQGVSESIQGIWKLVSPTLEAVVSFAQTKLGISVGLIGFAIIPLCLAGMTEKNTPLSIALLAAGVLSAAAGGAFFVASGILSNILPAIPGLVN